MDQKDKITLEAKGEFPFTFWVEKAIPSEENDELIIEGIASTTNVDHDKERMSEEALRAMEAAINNEGVPLRVEHQKEELSIIGKVFKAWVDERNQLHIRARLDKNHPVGPILHQSMKSGTKMGLSVGGLVKRAVKEFVESVGGTVKTFYDVALQEVSVTPRPSNYDSWLVAKSIAKDQTEAKDYSENEGLRREFLFENAQLDYLQSFAKSIPNKAWQKIENNNINKNNNTDMKKEEEKKEKEDETEKSVSRAEFSSLSKGFKDLQSLVAKGFDSIGSLISKAMDSEAEDQANPKEKKPDDESPTAKAMDSEADGTDLEGGREKSSKTKKTEDETYDMETINRSIATLKSIEKRLKGMKKTSSSETEEETEKKKTKKATDKEEDETEKSEEEDETEKSSKYHPLDIFVATLTKSMEAMMDVMEKQGKRFLGFEKSFIDSPEIQKTVKELMKVPGFKKSVAMGIPYMVSKDGVRTPLLTSAEKVEKSQEQPKDFRSAYKQNYSSVSQDAQ